MDGLGQLFFCFVFIELPIDKGASYRPQLFVFYR